MRMQMSGKMCKENKVNDIYDASEGRKNKLLKNKAGESTEELSF